MELGRRAFLKSSAALAATGVAGAMSAEAAVVTDSAIAEQIELAMGPLIHTAPFLVNAAATTMDIVFGVKAEALGFVEYGLKRDLSDAKRAYSGKFPVKGIDKDVLQVRLENLQPATRYYYRIGAERIQYWHGYDMRNLGAVVEKKIYSFTTLGLGNRGAFAVINDTHERIAPLEMCLAKLRELKPAVAVWNGDANNTSETIEDLKRVFLQPHFRKAESEGFAAELPFLYVNGNHDFRGRANLESERCLPKRSPLEREARFHQLGRNFAERLGEIALIGLDTGEDKLDTNPLFAGLFAMKPYREEQAKWLAAQFERPEIAAAKFKVVFCHIPLYSSNPHLNPGDLAPADVAPGFEPDFAGWQRTCATLWSPLFVKHGVQLVIAAHEHVFRYDEPTAERPWAQLVGGGPNLSKGPSFPTVIEGKEKDGKLHVKVFDVLNERIVLEKDFA